VNGERAAGAARDVGVPGLVAGVHRAPGEDVDQGVGVPRQVGEDVPTAPAREQGGLGDGGVVQAVEGGEQALGGVLDGGEVGCGRGHDHTLTPPLLRVKVPEDTENRTPVL
jgi:hypothetical protein